MKQWKQDAFNNFANRQSELSDDHKIEQLSEWHFRIDDYIDVWPSGKKYSFTKYPARVFRYKKIEDIFNHKKNRMAKWKPTQAGLLSQVIKETPELVDGKKATLYVEPFLSNDGNFLNVKIEVEDGNKYLATISDFSGKRLAEAWGGEMFSWIGRKATIEVKESRDYKKYVNFIPTEETNPELYKPLSEADKQAIQIAKEAEATPATDESDADKIPF